MPVGAGTIHLLPERQDGRARDKRVGIAMADENTCLNCTRLRGKVSIQQPMKAYAQEHLRPVARELQRRLPAHAEANCCHGQVGRERAAKLLCRAQSPPVGFRVGAQPGREALRGVQILRLRTIKIAQYGKVACLGQAGGLFFDGFGRIHDRGEHQHGCARRTGRMPHLCGERGFAIHVAVRFPAIMLPAGNPALTNTVRRCRN